MSFKAPLQGRMTAPTHPVQDGVAARQVGDMTVRPPFGCGMPLSLPAGMPPHGTARLGTASSGSGSRQCGLFSVQRRVCAGLGHPSHRPEVRQPICNAAPCPHPACGRRVNRRRSPCRQTPDEPSGIDIAPSSVNRRRSPCRQTRQTSGSCRALSVPLSPQVFVVHGLACGAAVLSRLGQEQKAS